MASFQFDDVHLPPNPAPPSGRILGVLVPDLDDQPGRFEIVFRDDDADKQICRKDVEMADLEPTDVDCAHEVDTGDEIEQRNLTVRVDSRPTSMPLPVWLRGGSTG